jgi:hypothetical protein
MVTSHQGQNSGSLRYGSRSAGPRSRELRSLSGNSRRDGGNGSRGDGTSQFFQASRLDTPRLRRCQEYWGAFFPDADDCAVVVGGAAQSPPGEVAGFVRTGFAVL